MQWQLPKICPGSSDAAAEEKRPSPSSTSAACAATTTMLPPPSTPANSGGAVAVVVVSTTATAAATTRTRTILYAAALASVQLLRLRLVVLLAATALLLECCGAALLVHKYSTRVVRTKYGPLRGVMVHVHPPVEAFLGVPYATPPVGSLRFMPPVTPSLWKNTRLADRFSPVCPQKPPDIGNRTEALLDYPRGRLLYLEKLLPLLANQSEDCLYLNLYVPRTDTGEEEPIPVPCIVYVHGESFEWNSGNPYDGTVLASSGRVIVVTVNFRLGVLGFLKTGTKGSAQGNFGLMDLVAGLHWLRENLPAFGGDPEKVTLMGHGTGAALVNYIAVSPVAKELLHRVILLSGSGLSPWALQRDPLFVKRRVAEQTGCHGDLLDDDLAPCLRLKPLSQLLCITIDPPRFLPGFAPFIDGTILLNPTPSHASSFASSSSSSSSTVATSAGFELADFPDRNLLIGITSTESYLDLSAQDLEFGFNESRRDRILRTYVRNCYYYHLNEIFSTLKNEYTDWERPSQNPLSVRDGTLDVLSDGHTVSPLIRVGYLHALRGGHTYVMHFQHQTGERDFPQRGGSVRGDDIPYVLGLPLVNGGAFFPHNYSYSDILTSKTLLHYLGNFARKGDPNGAVPSISGAGSGVSASGSSSSTAAASASASAAGIVPPGSSSASVRSYTTSVSSSDVHAPFWDTYDTINQLYLELGNKPEMRSHYRGHKMSLWLNLIPQLHRAAGDGDDLSMRHHHFQEEGDQYYDGSVRPQTMQKPTLVHLVPPPTISTTAKPPPTLTTPIIPTTTPQQPPKSPDPSLQTQGTTECPPNNTYLLSSTKGGVNSMNNNNLLRKLAASNHYQSYTTALTVTIAVGCFLLLLNVLIFAGIYHQRDRSKGREDGGKSSRRKKKEEMLEGGTEYTQSYRSFPLGSSGGAGGSCSSSSGEGYDSKSSLYDPRSSSVAASQVGVVGYQMKAAGGGFSGSSYDCKQLPTYIGEYGCEKYGLEEMQMTQLALQEFQSSPPSGMKRNSETTILMANTASATSNHPPPDVTTTVASHLITSSCKESQTTRSGSDMTSPSSIPEPPPPPKSQPPTAQTTSAAFTQSQHTQCPVGGGAGILRSSSTHGSGAPTSAHGTMKKRVQIQEISV